MKITRTEKGEAHGRDYVQPYVIVYTQPVVYSVVAWLYHHVWEKSTWRALRRIENLREKYGPETGWGYIPYTNRQDIRCYNLHAKKRIEVSKTYGEKVKRS